MRPSRPPSFDLRLTLGAYTGVVALLLALLPIQHPQDGSRVAVAGGLLVAVIGLLGWADQVPQRRTPAVAGIATFLFAVALLRDSTPGGGGYGALVLLPVVWCAIRGRRPELLVALCGGAAVFVVPLILVGGADYPASGWRSAVLIQLVGFVLGGRVVRLVRGLREAADHSSAILASMSEGYALTSGGRIVAVNRALCELTGLSEAQIVGATPPYPFWAPELEEETMAVLREVVAAGGGEFEICLARADGERFPASITATPVPDADGRRVFLNTIRDITARRAHEEAVLRRADELVSIAEVTRALSHSDHNDVRRTICQVALDVAGATTATIWEAGETGGLGTTCSLGAPAPELPYGAPGHDDATMVALRNGRPLFIADAAASPRIDPRMFSGERAASAHFQPILAADGTRGVLAVTWREPLEELPTHAALLLEVLAAEAAAALDRNDLLGRLERLSHTDELTGLANRRAWDDRLGHELARARRSGQSVAVAMLDLDHFKDYNDRHGHLAGDEMLRAAARVWRADLRESDVLARWGGEEFALLLPGCELERAQGLVERLRGLLPDDVTFSAGVAAFDARAPLRDLIAAADRALYDAKRLGRDRVLTASSPAGV